VAQKPKNSAYVRVSVKSDFGGEQKIKFPSIKASCFGIKGRKYWTVFKNLLL